MWHDYPFSQRNKTTKREGEYWSVFEYLCVVGRGLVKLFKKGQAISGGGGGGVFIKQGDQKSSANYAHLQLHTKWLDENV